jgi:triacylglycerol esterase/lipase EstA (alpha/beta hydrolase family)
MNTTPENTQHAILLHGILKSRTDMQKIGRTLERDGYTPHNITYPSRQQSLEDLTTYLHTKLKGIPASDTIHFVGHSMGGLLTRYYIHRYHPKNLGRVVMLSTPNTGSEFADKLKSTPILRSLYKSIYGPAGQQLSIDHHHPDTITYPLGIIAGTRSINPLSPIFLPRKHIGPHDGMVPVTRTKIDGMADHITMPVNHTTMMKDPRVITQVKHFLKHKKFTEI